MNCVHICLATTEHYTVSALKNCKTALVSNPWQWMIQSVQHRQCHPHPQCQSSRQDFISKMPGMSPALFPPPIPPSRCYPSPPPPLQHTPPEPLPGPAAQGAEAGCPFVLGWNPSISVSVKRHPHTCLPHCAHYRAPSPRHVTSKWSLLHSTSMFTVSVCWIEREWTWLWIDYSLLIWKQQGKEEV